MQQRSPERGIQHAQNEGSYSRAKEGHARGNEEEGPPHRAGGRVAEMRRARVVGHADQKLPAVGNDRGYYMATTKSTEKTMVLVHFAHKNVQQAIYQ
mmetsp:Transcript_23432/g.69352  ORF Transcript_23432/g.69352 Transcript_23432/m.69352 type:complete len:97 (-) Transcript_23432:9-299(-)